jgi:hypothetical protein
VISADAPLSHHFVNTEAIMRVIDHFAMATPMFLIAINNPFDALRVACLELVLILRAGLSLLTNHFSLLTVKFDGIVEPAVVDGVPSDSILSIDLGEAPVPGNLLVDIFGLGLHPSLNHRIGAVNGC